MNILDLTLDPHQAALVEAPFEETIFLAGPAGTGKTTVGVRRMLHLLAAGVPAAEVLVLTPQRTLAAPYQAARRHPDAVDGGLVNVATVGGLARRMIDLFWPLVAPEAGFGHPDERPIFLTLETAQYYMARIVNPLLESGAFDTITIDRHRIYSQIIDNLNKAAVVGFPPAEIAERLKGAWIGEPAQAHVYDEAQAGAMRFRSYCLEHNLLDFSLQIELFFDYLWPEPLCRDYLLESYPHLIVDNVEEDTPVAHDLIYAWLPRAASALVIFDEAAGYRSFLGADPESARMIRDLCDRDVTFADSYVTTPALQAFAHALVPEALPLAASAPAPTSSSSEKEPVEALPIHFAHCRYHPEMLDWVADQIAALVHEEGVAPEEIVVLAPFLSDALRFSLVHRLQQREVPVRSHRPSRALREEPATQTLLTLAALAHPDWGLVPTRYDVAYALMHAIADLDLVRAQLLADILYQVSEGRPALATFDGIQAEMQERVTFLLGGRYEALRMWLATYIKEVAEEGGEAAPLDHFLARLFGELLSQPGYGFHEDLDAGKVTAMLIESVRKFRYILRDITRGEEAEPDNEDAEDAEVPIPPEVVHPPGREYIAMVQDGVIAAQYLTRWQDTSEPAVLLAPAYTFLLRNEPVAVQCWLNVGSHGWWERLYQPLTHPYVLSRRWPVGKDWTDADEVAAREATLYRLALGLIRRCRREIYLGLSELGEQGFEQQGPLLKAIQRILRERSLAEDTATLAEVP